MEVYIIAGGFILFDILTGVIKALYNGEFNSSVMRQGGWHKLAEVTAIVGATLLQYASTKLELGFEVPMVNATIIYICAMETFSSLENICMVNPELKKFFKPYLEKLNAKENE